MSCGYIRSCFTLQLLISFLWSVSEAGAGPAVLCLLDQLEYFKQRTVKPFVQFSGKTFSSIPWLGFSSVKGRVSLGHLAVLRFEVSSDHLDFRQVLLTFRLRFLWHRCHLKSYCLD